MQKFDLAVFEFEHFSLNPQSRVLLRSGNRINLSPKLFEVLRVLVENHGHTVSRTSLIQQVWPRIAVSEANLTQSIFVLRKLLENKSARKRLILTVPGEGYRFVASVQRVKLALSQEAHGSASLTTAREANISKVEGAGVSKPGKILNFLPSLEGFSPWKGTAFGQFGACFWPDSFSILVRWRPS
jgi:DNA-binding winged helix-turn-helix (wHTH) protein